MRRVRLVEALTQARLLPSAELLPRIVVPRDNDAVLAEIVERTKSLSSKYLIFPSVSFRAIVQFQADRIDRKWVNLLASLRLSDEELGRSFESQFLSEPDLYHLQASFDLASLEPFLEKMVRTKRYEFGDGASTLEVALDHPQASPPNFEDVKLLGSFDWEWPYREGRGGVIYFFNTHHPLDQYRPTSEALHRLGYSDIHRLLKHRLFSLDGTTFHQDLRYTSTGVYVILPNYHARLKDVTLEGRTVKVTVETAEAVPPGDFMVTLEATATEEGQPVRYIDLPPKVWQNLPAVRLEHTYSVAPHYVHAGLYWNPGANDIERFVDRMTARRAELVRTPRLATYEHFDLDLSKLREALLTDKMQFDFEWAIATLLATAGFQVQWLGYRGKAIQSEVDIIAYLPDERQVLLGECTVKGGDISRKISDLSEKAREVEEVLKGWAVHKVLFTTTSNAAIQLGHEQSAQESHIALVTKDVLPNFLQAVKSAVPPPLLLERLRPDTHKYPRLAD